LDLTSRSQWLPRQARVISLYSTAVVAGDAMQATTAPTINKASCRNLTRALLVGAIALKGELKTR